MVVPSIYMCLMIFLHSFQKLSSISPNKLATYLRITSVTTWILELHSPAKKQHNKHISCNRYDTNIIKKFYLGQFMVNKVKFWWLISKIHIDLCDYVPWSFAKSMIYAKTNRYQKSNKLFMKLYQLPWQNLIKIGKIY